MRRARASTAPAYGELRLGRAGGGIGRAGELRRFKGSGTRSVTSKGMAPPQPLTDALAEGRERTLALVSPLTDEDVERQHVEIMSPLVWDLAHIAAYEELWLVHRHGGQPLSRPALAAMYDAFETPRAVRGGLPLLDRAEAMAYLDDVRERVPGGDSFIHELVLRHEHQHGETMLQ